MSRRTVLVVEDDDDLRSAFRDALAMVGFVVREAQDGLEALRIIDSAPPDVVVLDIGLPEISGHDVLRELSEVHTRSIPVIVVTGMADHFPALPPDRVLRKPVAPFELVRRVQQCVVEPV